MKYNFINSIFLSLTVLVFSLTCIVSCESADGIIDVTNPEVSNFSESISSAPGLEFKFEGEITDQIGIASVNIYYADWFLDKEIVMNEKPKEYTLNYKFEVPEDAIPASSHTVKVDITDLGGNIVSMDVLVTLDVDITNPVLAFINPVAGTKFAIGDVMSINVNVSDDFELQSIQVKSELIHLEDVIDMSAGENTYSYSKEIEIPAGYEGSVIIEATATDMQGNAETETVTVLVGSSNQFTDVYLVGGSVWYGWDPTKATKMWQDPNDDNWFVGEFYYKTGDDIKFIGQLDWAPLNWGLDPSDSSKMINSQDTGAIGFPDGDGYYTVKFNPYVLEYSYEKMTVDITEKENMYIMGKGFVGYNLDWNPADAIAMIKDGPYVFSMEVEFSEAVDLKFIGQNDGWGPYDSGFEIGGEMLLPLNYVKGVIGDGSPDVKFLEQPGRYKITFDYFLLRTTIQPL
jgi:hypothetical protein